MNCRRAQRWLLGGGTTGRIEQGVRQHTSRCAACRAIDERNEVLRKLLSLKRFEYPDARLEERILGHIHGELAAGRRADAEGHVRDPAGWLPAPATWRYALAGVLMLLLGIDHFFSRPSRMSPMGDTGSPFVAGVPDRRPGGDGTIVTPPTLAPLPFRGMTDPWGFVPRTAPTNTVHQPPTVFIQHEP